MSSHRGQSEWGQRRRAAQVGRPRQHGGVTGTSSLLLHTPTYSSWGLGRRTHSYPLSTDGETRGWRRLVLHPGLGAGPPEPPPGAEGKGLEALPSGRPCPAAQFQPGPDEHIPAWLPTLPSASDNSERARAQRTDAHRAVPSS